MFLIQEVKLLLYSIILDSSAMRVCSDNYDIFRFCGIELEELSDNTIVIRSCSKLIEKCGVNGAFDILLNHVSKGISKEYHRY